MTPNPKPDFSDTAIDTTTGIDADIAILGGGLVGLSLALAFADTRVGAGLRVALVDNNPTDIWSKAKFDGRASAITATSRVMLDTLGVWSAIADHAEPMRDIIVTDSEPGAVAHPVLLKFEAPGGHDSRGTVAAHMIENVRLGAALAQQVTGTGTVLVIAPRQGHRLSARPGQRRTRVGLRAHGQGAAGDRRRWQAVVAARRRQYRDRRLGL